MCDPVKPGPCRAPTRWAPTSSLAGTLGIDITVVVKWQRAAAGDWAAYAAEVNRRTTPRQPIHEPGATP